MSTSYHLCTPDDLPQLSALCLRRAEESGAQPDPSTLEAGLAPLCAGGAEGAAYLFGPIKAPVGYMVLTFSWAPDLAAPVASIHDVFIRPSVRQRGLASTAVSGVARALREGGIARIDAQLSDDPASRALAARCGFTPAQTTSLHRRL